MALAISVAPGWPVFALTKTSCCARNPCADAARSDSGGLCFLWSDESAVESEVYQESAGTVARSCELHHHERKFPVNILSHARGRSPIHG